VYITIKYAHYTGVINRKSSSCIDKRGQIDTWCWLNLDDMQVTNAENNVNISVAVGVV
jgi:hypothetical protein